MHYHCIGLILAAAAVACGRVSLPAYSNAARNRALGAPIHPHRLCRAPVLLTRSWVVIGMQAGRDETTLAKPACLSGDWPSVPSAHNNAREHDIFQGWPSYSTQTNTTEPYGHI